MLGLRYGDRHMDVDADLEPGAIDRLALRRGQVRRIMARPDAPGNQRPDTDAAPDQQLPPVDLSEHGPRRHWGSVSRRREGWKASQEHRHAELVSASRRGHPIHG